MTLDLLKRLFPKTNPQNCAVTGYIPVEFVEEHSRQIDALIKEHGLRRVYRGPRRHYRFQSRTWKQDAVAVVLYVK